MIRCAWVALLAAGCLGSAHPGDGAMSGDDMALGSADDLADVAPADLLAPPPPDMARGYSTDPATFFGDSRCASLHAQLCEDFEAGNPGDKPSTTLWTTSGDATLDTAQVARGKQALHLHIVGQAWATIAETQTFPEPNNHFFGRLFFRASAIPTTAPNTAAHWTLVAGAGDNTAEIREGGIVGKWGTGTDNQAADGTGDWTNADDDPSGNPKPVPANTWACVEWEYDGSTNETRFWWDGVEHPSMHTTSTMHGGNTNPYLLPPFTNVKIGWMLYQMPANPTTFDVWIDEIAIDTMRIGCNN